MREETILRKIRSGDPAGLEALMERYLPYVSAVVWSVLRDAMPREDGEAVARNKSKKRLRQAGRYLPLEEDALEIPGPDDPPGEYERAVERQLVRQAVDSLPDPDREVFLRHYFYAQTVAEVARRMELNESTVKTKLRRGRMKLKEVLTREGFAIEA